MSQNVVYMITELYSGKILDLEKRSFQKEMSFNSFFPARYLAESFLNRDLDDKRGKYYKITEGEIVEFLNNQLTVACEEQEESENFTF